MELGRAFVCKEYQKSYQPLMLLWKGIGRFVAARPQYRILFGPVSINSDYHSVSRDLIVAFSRTNQHTELARLVRGANPVRLNPLTGSRLREASGLIWDIHDLSELISDIERDRKGIPILLKHYMKLGGKFLGFSTDRNFSDVVDALVMVDLTQVGSATLGRYMGEEGAESFPEVPQSRDSRRLCLTMAGRALAVKGKRDQPHKRSYNTDSREAGFSRTGKFRPRCGMAPVPGETKMKPKSNWKVILIVIEDLDFARRGAGPDAQPGHPDRGRLFHPGSGPRCHPPRG